ncbi:phospholipase A2 inhibitor and Ly6/PLAUR domain-containing protein-like [Eleutherodactylus coqui]|uniref:phospholipase A2 inhibitor and Ly6/PLAUR domain-containing protein-like n=1 Tax=Eleutherodactylus coqui TaxID=57060 RepID=UPI003462B97A
MISLIGFLSLFSALTATSSAISCTKCASTSMTCSGSSITCPDGFMCGSEYTDLGEGLRAKHLIRKCTPSSECNFSGSMTMTEERFALGISCCSTDNCTPTLPTVPTKGHNPNGVICPSCASAKSTSCYTSDTIQCTADENMCLLEAIEIKGSASGAMRGCGTKSYCDLGSQSYTAGGSTIKTTYTCTSSAISAHKVVLTPAIVCLLVLKLFL